MTVRGTVDVDGGSRAFTYHFDHNAIADAVRVGESLVTLTASGNLLRFDATTLTMTAQAVVPGRGTAISVDDRGRVLLGTEDGRIASVDPLTLGRTLVMRDEGAVHWVSQTATRLVAVLKPMVVEPWPGEPVDAYFTALERARWSVLVREGGRSRRHQLPERFEPNGFAVDGNRLWMAVDRGEFGGSLRAMDLGTGRMTSVEGDRGVRGLLRTKAGRLLSYGGLAHFGLSDGFIGRVEDGRQQILFEVEAGPVPLDNAPRPDGPIDRILEDEATGGFLVLSSHVLYRANADFTAWSRRADLGGRWHAGSRFATANTPTINTLLPTPDHDDELLAISGRDGVMRESAGTVRRFSIPAQLESSIVDIWPTSIGVLFLPLVTSPEMWRQSNGGWEPLAICPEEFSGSGSIPVQDDGPGVVSFCAPNTIPGRAAFWNIDAQGRLAMREEWRHHPPETPDEFLSDAQGRIIGLGGLGTITLQTWNGREWLAAGSAPVEEFGRQLGLSGRAHVTVSTSGDGRALIWDVWNGSLRWLTSPPNGQDSVRFERVTRRELTNVSDAIADGNDAALVATSRGVFRYVHSADRVEPVPSPARDHVFTIARDREGRLWAAGDRLYVSPDGAGRTWRLVDLPMLSPTRAKRIRVGADGTLWVSVFDRGVVEIH